MNASANELVSSADVADAKAPLTFSPSAAEDEMRELRAAAAFGGLADVFLA